MIKLHRLHGSDKQTIGCLTVEYGNRLFATFATLELPDKDNQPNISRIPAGNYKIEKFISTHNGECFLLKDVPNRSMIELHSGNYYSQIAGCILVGMRHKDINDDGEIDVVESRNAIEKLYSLLPQETTIQIIDEI